jgi:hypothetical protein
MNPLNLFILSSQLALSVFVAANPIVSNNGLSPLLTVSKKCTKGDPPLNKPFYLWTLQKDGKQLTISSDGQAQVGVDGGAVLIARFEDTPVGSTTPWYGNLGGRVPNSQWTLHGYFKVRPDPQKTNGGGYALKFDQLSADPPTDNSIYEHLQWTYDCKYGSPILRAIDFADGTDFMGCAVDDGGDGGALNIAFEVGASTYFNQRCNNKIPYLYIDYDVRSD